MVLLLVLLKAFLNHLFCRMFLKTIILCSVYTGVDCSRKCTTELYYRDLNRSSAGANSVQSVYCLKISASWSLKLRYNLHRTRNELCKKYICTCMLFHIPSVGFHFSNCKINGEGCSRSTHSLILVFLKARFALFCRVKKRY